MPDKFEILRPYLAEILRPGIPHFSTSHNTLARLYVKHGRETVDSLLAVYFEECGDNGQRDPLNHYAPKGTRTKEPRKALDFPRIDPALWVVWTNSDRPAWPDARRDVRYMSGYVQAVSGLPIWADWTNAATFETEQEAHEFRAKYDAKRKHPYGGTVSTVADVIRLQFNNGESME